MNVYIITSAKFEECYIEEWVQYHLNIGFDKIIINDNNPKDYPYNPKDILKKYIDNGQVIVERYYDSFEIPTNLDFPDDDIWKIYTWLYNKYKDKFDWVAKLDIDEYLKIPETNNDIKSFLSQSKFNNVLSIVIPWKVYKVKDKYNTYYTRLKNNRDRFIFNHMECDLCANKSIVKNTKYVCNIGLHYANFHFNLDDEINGKNLIKYAFPDGINAEDKVKLFKKDYKCNELLIHYVYFYNMLNNICCINHYSVRSIEESVNHLIKFDTSKYKNWHLYKKYLIYYNKHKDMFDNPRDLYKIYFINDINHINKTHKIKNIKQLINFKVKYNIWRKKYNEKFNKIYN